MEKRTPSTLEEQQQESAMDLIYDMVYESAKKNGVIDAQITIEEFKDMKIREVLEILQEKGINTFEIQM